MAALKIKKASAFLLLLAGVWMLCSCDARHIHGNPHHHQRDNPEDVWDKGDKDERIEPEAAADAGAGAVAGAVAGAAVRTDDDTDEIAPIDIINNVRPVWFVPINSKYFFGIKEPCEDGYRRDRFGICREVWD